MPGSRINPALLTSIAVSVVLHLMLLLPLWMLAMSSSSNGVQLHDDVLSPPAPPEPELGIDAPNPSSLTWVGYDEYREHIAALAELDQAAFTEHPGESEPETVAGHAEMDRDADPVEADETDEFAEPPTELTDADTDATMDDPTPPGTDEPAAVESSEQPLVVPVDPLAGDLPWIGPLRDAVNQSPSESDSPTPDEAEPIDERAAPEDTVESETESGEATDQTPEDAADEGTDEPEQSGGEEGDQPLPESDRESDPTSTIQAEAANWRLGQPLAAEGVELKPQRPNFTLLQLLTASPGNPHVLIRFRNDGVPVEAVVERSSGSASVDSSIETSLYRWRAEGEAIDALQDGQTFDVRIRIVLNRRAD